MKQAIFLFNKESGRCKITGHIDTICQVFKHNGYDLTPTPIDFTNNPFEHNKDIELIVVAGGDGTVNYVVNSMKDCDLNIPIGVIPAGTANDFAHALGMSNDIIKAASQIATGSERAVDCGCVNGKYFINILSFGVFTTTSQRTPDKLKHKIGKLAYILEGAKEFFNIHHIPLTITADGEEHNLDSFMVMILNGVTAGGFNLARGASIDDGLFDCVILEKRSIAHSTIAMGSYILGGTPKIVKVIKAKNISISATINEPTDVDGQKGSDFPLNIECLAGALRIIAPTIINE